MRNKLLLSLFAFSLAGAAGCDDDEPLMPRPDATTTDTARPDTVAETGAPDTVGMMDAPRVDAMPDAPADMRPSDAGDARVDTPVTADVRPDAGDGGADAADASDGATD
jgi:hypothetical protein